MERHVENALKVVQYLKDQPLVEKVNHPSISEDKEQQELYKKYFPNGGGSIFTFEIKGGAKEAQKFIDNLELFSLLANVADVKSLAIHPASTTHSECNEAELLDQGIKPNTIRLSIGTENVDDIIDILAIDLIGVVPDDQGIIISTNRGEPVVAANDGSRSGQAYRNITRRITGEDVPIMDMEETRGFLGKLKSLFSRN